MFPLRVMSRQEQLSLKGGIIPMYKIIAKSVEKAGCVAATAHQFG